LLLFVRYQELRAGERLCDSCCSKPVGAVAEREKNFFFEKKFTATLPEQKAELRSREQTE